MPDFSRVGAGHLATLMDSALEREDAATLAVLRAKLALRASAEQEACRRGWIRLCPGRKARRRTGESVLWELAAD